MYTHACNIAVRIRRLPDQDSRGLSRVDLKAIHELSLGAVGVHCARCSCSCLGYVTDHVWGLQHAQPERITSSLHC
jgi:hypothetical protein